MSASFRPIEKVDAAELFDGRLEKFGVRQHFNPRETCETEKWLTDGHNYLKVYIDDDGTVQDFIRWMPNGDPTHILIAIEDTFDTVNVSELEPQYWGFETHDEWRAWDRSMGLAWEEEEFRKTEEFYIELCKYLRGQPNGIEPGTGDEEQAQIAKTLVEKDPSLMELANKDRLMEETKFIWSRLDVPF